MRVDVWSYYSVDRPPVKFHRIWSSFDAPTINYSDSIAGLFVGRFRSPKTVTGSLSSLLSAQGLLHSPLPTARPNLTSLVSPRPSLRACPKIVPNPTRGVITVGSGSSPNVYKTSLFCLLGYLTYSSQTVRFLSEGPNSLTSNPLPI